MCYPKESEDSAMHMHHHPEEHHSSEELLALLQYAVSHNKHHTEELHELSHEIEGEAGQLIHDACVDFQVGNEKLEEALRIFKEE